MDILKEIHLNRARIAPLLHEFYSGRWLDSVEATAN